MHETKRNRRDVPPTQRAWLASAFFLVLAPVALANPGGEEIAAGAVQIERAEALTRIQASDGAIIDWHGGFSIGAGETVEFIQPDAFSEVLNRDYSNDASRIDGSLFANGRVTIANPFGVFIGEHALVDVAHLTAAAGHVSERDFLAGNLHFGGLTGVVENRGTIRADAVTLLGRRVANRGLIVSGDGTIALLAGSEIWIGEFGSPVRISLGSFAADGAAIENSGTLDAGRGSVRMAAGDVLGLAIHNTGSVAAGTISLNASAGEVQISGSLDASDRGANGSGGSIEVGGEQIALQSAVLDVSGDTGGGSIRVGADAHGETLPGLRRARVVRVDAESSLRADAGETGDGGSIVVFADEAATVVGTLSARGGATGGDGGFIETSGIDFLAVSGARVNASAPHGAPGEWLLDPRDVEIVDGSESGGTFDDGDPNTFTPNDSGEETAAATVDAADIVSTLNNGTSVTITTSEPTFEQAGNISVLAPIHSDVPDGVTAKLTLDAVGNIFVEEVVSDAAGNGALNIDLLADSDIKFDATINTPKGITTLQAGRGDDGGSILNTLATTQAKIT
ncbi:MAG: filamentous hemagglutinin N-terminal domain-containing protein, partial [Myxococcota bacterium]